MPVHSGNDRPATGVLRSESGRVFRREQRTSPRFPTRYVDPETREALVMVNRRGDFAPTVTKSGTERKRFEQVRTPVQFPPNTRWTGRGYRQVPPGKPDSPAALHRKAMDASARNMNRLATAAEALLASQLPEDVQRELRLSRGLVTVADRGPKPERKTSRPVSVKTAAGTRKHTGQPDCRCGCTKMSWF